MFRSRLAGALLISAAALVTMGASLSFQTTAWAGGVTFDDPDDDANAGPPFSGIVRDRDGGPISDAKVTVTVKIFNSSLILRTDPDGHFTVNGFDKSVSPDDVEIACSKDGYVQFAVSRRPTADPKAPIPVTCILQKQS
ncbi:MAG TPA: carboxypeptidase-like regulatory domain-containing protein [Beijerinckiaceae bacterium]|jgi:hypothetical protein|nr:carboxypeptidase-like regulatory domain-containing protein [Beijerinckiaceae bacterium]